MSQKSAKGTPWAIYFPKDVEARYRISCVTRWRWERDGKLPKRDVFLGGEPTGWYRATLEDAEKRPS